MLGGIAAVIAVILVLEGFEQGIYAQLRGAVHDRGGDLVATQAGVSNMVAVRSVIPQLARDDVEAVSGVRIAHPLAGLSVIYEKNARKNPIFLIVFDSAGGPTSVRSGHLIDGDRQIVIDRSLAELHGLEVGEPLVISGFSFEIVGITGPNAAIFTPFAFTTFDTLIDFYFESSLAADLSAFPLVSYFIIELDPGADRDAVAKAIEAAVPAIDVFTPDQIAAHDEELGRSIVGAIIRTLIVVAYLSGVLVVGLFTFAATASRRTDLGILKALGFRSRSLLAAVVIETVVLTVAAIPVGVVAALGIAALVEWSSPVYAILPAEGGPLIRTIAACAGFAVLGSLVSYRQIHGVEPAEVFQS
jgi:ABC-type antimicrobial peptide transport system permease subunit